MYLINNRRCLQTLKKILKKIPSLFLVASLLFLAFSIYVTQTSANSDDVFIFGYKPVFVLSGSMEPTLKTNGVAIAKKVPSNEVKQNDIIMFKKDNLIISHRVIKINNDGSFVTKGDNNSTEDNFVVTKGEVKGKIVLTLNWVAPIVDYCKQPWGIVKLLLYVASILFVLCFIKFLIKQLVFKRRGPPKKTDSDRG